MQTERRVVANLHTKQTVLSCESADKWLLPSTSTVAHLLLLLGSKTDTHFTIPLRVDGCIGTAVRVRCPCRGCISVTVKINTTIHSLTPRPGMPPHDHCDLQMQMHVNNLSKVVTRQRADRKSKLQPSSCESNALTTTLPSHQFFIS